MAVLWLAMPNTASAQLLENRGKLKTMKGEGRGFLHFLKSKKIKSAEPAGTFSGKKGKVKYSPTPKPVKKSNPKYSEPSGVLDFSNEVPSPRYSPPNDKRFKGKKNKVKSISGSMNWFGSDGRKSYFNPSISGFQGQQRRPNQKGSKLYYKDISRIQSKVVVQSSPIKRQWSEAGFQGFDKGKNRRGSKLYFRDLSKDHSKVIISSIPFENATRNSHKFQGFDKGRNRKGSKLYFRELSREQSKVLISAIPFENATRNSHKFKGLDKGKNRLGEKLYYREVSRDLSGVVISYNKPAVFTDTHKFRGLSRDRSRWGEWWFQWETSRSQARYEGTQQTISYADKMKYADKMAGKMAGYTGGFKTPKRNNQMHPSASYVYGKRASSPSQKELFRKLNVVWVRVNGNKVQPDSVKDKPEKLKFDKKEKDLWNY
ncbi:MAG: hypothetical protein RIC80_10760 [Cyclobacteriaceae bacterium]